MRWWREAREDAVHLARSAYGSDERHNVRRAVLSNDSFLILLLWRWRAAVKRWHIPLLNTVLRRIQTIVFGIEIGNEVTLGRGVYFVHPIGTVVGGDARIGDRVRIMGANTVGTAKDNGYPTIEDEVVIGVGARVLGPICVGARTVVGANAVVVTDLPPDRIAVGIPARTRPSSHEGNSTEKGNSG